MVFFGDFGSAISSGFRALSEGFKSVCDTVSSIGKGVAEFAHNIKPVLGPILMTIAQAVPHPVVKVVANFANTLLQILSIFHSDENVSDMGDRALQAADQDITIEKFDNFDEYMAALRNFDLNPDLSRKYNAAEKLIAGLGVATLGIEDKFKANPGSLSDLWLFPVVNPEYFTPERIKGWLENGRTIGDIGAYLEKHMSGEEASVFRKNLEITPEGKPMNDAELGNLQEVLDSSRTKWVELNQQLQGSN